MSKSYRSSAFGLGAQCAAVFLLLAGLLLPVWLSEAEAGGEAVAKVNDTVFTEDDLQQAIDEIIPKMLYHRGVTPEKRESFRPQAIEKIIKDELLYQESLRIGLKIDEKKVKDARKRTIKRLGGKKQFKAALKQAGLTDREYREKLRRTFLIEKILKVEVEDKAQVSDDEARKHYDDNRAGFKKPEARRARHILISVAPNAMGEEWEARKERAEEALRKIKDGEDMASVAWDYSDGAYRVKGGDMGLLHKGRFAAGIEDAIFKLKEGELSGIIQTIYGYHIVRVEEVAEPEQLEFEDVRQKIKRKITDRRAEELRDALNKRLRADALIVVH